MNPTYPDRIVFGIQQHHIDQGERGSAACPASLAIREENPEWAYVAVGSNTTYIIVSGKNGDSGCRYRGDQALIEFVEKFDAGKFVAPIQNVQLTKVAQ